MEAEVFQMNGMVAETALGFLQYVKSLVPHLHPDDLARVQRAAQDLTDLALQELEKR